MISKSVFIKKKRIMEQFSLEKYLANPSRKVVTRAETSVRILCTDKRDSTPIVALITDGIGREYIAEYNVLGKYCDCEVDTSFDLFFAPEKHEGWINIYRNEDEDYYKGMVIFSSKEDAIEKGRRFSDYITTTKIEWEE